MIHSTEPLQRSLGDPSTTDPGAPSPAPGDARKPRSATYAPILIVEDDPDLREMMAQLLLLEGFNAHAVANGREALDYLNQEEPPELILLDLMMPVMVLSALDPTRVGDLGEIAFLKKPLDFDRLVDLVRKYCPR